MNAPKRPHFENDAFVREYASARRARVEESLERALRDAPAGSAGLAEAMRYAVFSGGKRVRPLLCIAAAEACGGGLEQVLSAACAIELVHAFSLVHDDLPALDNDSLRRGHPTCHVRFGEATAILAGDALLARAFELLAEASDAPDPQRTLRALRIVTNALGVDGMAGGQFADLEARGRVATLDQVEFIHARKTASLVAATTMVGGVLAGASEASIAALRRFGWCVGLAFQMHDDLLDAVGDEATLGKPVRRDAAEGRATFPRCIGIEGTRRAAERHTHEALEAIGPLGDRALALRELAVSLLRREQ